MQKFMEAMSLIATFPTIVLSLLVVAEFFSVANESLNKRSAERNPEDWLAIGIALGLLADAVDNGYWLFPWSQSFASTSDNWLFDLGVYFNLPFRQGLGGYAAYCHLRAKIKIDGECNRRIEQLHRRFWMAWLAGLAYVVTIWN